MREMSTPAQPNPPEHGQLLVYADEDGRLKLDVRLEGETAWLTQAHMAALFQTSIPNVSMHLRNIHAEGELQGPATIKEFLIVRQEGNRQVSRAVDHYNLDAIISVGYRNKNGRNILTNAGKISHQMAQELAETEYDKFNRRRIRRRI
jgi:hypothetical protein